MYSQKIFNDNICFISGLHRSGKSLLTDIIPSIENTGLINKEPILGVLANMYDNQEINLKSARYLARYLQSNINYSNFIGRKLNLKKTDETRIYNHMNYQKYLKKMNSKVKIKIFENTKEKEISFYDVHNILGNLKFWTTINDNFKLINVERHPIDLTYSWYKNKLGSFSKSSINQVLVYNVREKIVPTYSKKWASRYVKMTELDRIIEIINQEVKKSEKNYKNYKKTNSILRMRYEDILYKPVENLHLVNEFLKLESRIFFEKYKKNITKKHSSSPNKRRLKLIDDRKNKLNFIRNKCSETYYKKLINLVNIYENEKLQLKQNYIAH